MTVRCIRYAEVAAPVFGVVLWVAVVWVVVVWVAVVRAALGCADALLLLGCASLI
jgi:hypothetical protein